MCDCGLLVDRLIAIMEAVGVLGAFFTALKQLDIQKKRIDSLEEKKIDSEYKPDLRIESFSGKMLTLSCALNIVLKNYSSHSINITNITDKSSYLQKQQFPYRINAYEDLYIYLKEDIREMPFDLYFDMDLEDELERKFRLTFISDCGRIVTKSLIEIKK